MLSKYDQWQGASRLKNRKSPPTEAEVDTHLKLLAELLHKAFELYLSNRDLLGDEFLMYIGNSIVRDWPRKEIHKRSIKAEAVFHKLTGESLTGLNRSQVQKKLKRAGHKMSDYLHHEHNPPISFFRDLPKLYEHLTPEIIYTELKSNYSVVWITKEENNTLNKNGFRSKRKPNTYKELEIELI